MTTWETDSGDVLAAGASVGGFTVRSVLGAGGFGVTYLAWDERLAKLVAVKEYFPREWAARRGDGTLAPRTGVAVRDYRWGLSRFLDEARALAKFDDRRIVRVHQFFESRGTAYLVLEHVEGRSLAEELEAAGAMPEARVRLLLDGLAVGLELVHGADLLHRDVKPSNVMLRGDGTPVLIDFGSARYALGAQSRSVTSLVTPGYAPIEQYRTDGEQGPWTDVYGLGALAYASVCGKPPADAPSRVGKVDPLVPVGSVSGVSDGFARAVSSALALFPEDRPQSVSAWRELLAAGGAVESAGAVVSAPADGGRSADDESAEDGAPPPSPVKWRHRAAYGLAAVVVVAVVVASWLPWSDLAMPAGEVPAGYVAPREPPPPVQSPVVGSVLDLGVRDDSVMQPSGSATFQDCPTCPELVVIPAGTFRMGSPASERDRSDGEGPQHRVTLSAPFALGVSEVTFAEWDACVRGGGCNGYHPDDGGWGRGTRPVINVSWEDAQAYVRWLSRATGATYRLSSESEWEYAARAGTRTARYWGEAAFGQCRYANGWDDSAPCPDGHRNTAPVRSYAPNEFGLYDVLGNVWEWTEDCWHDNYVGAPSDGTAWTRGGECGRRVLRGGSWNSNPGDLRSANHNWFGAGARRVIIGFRVARTLD